MYNDYNETIYLPYLLFVCFHSTMCLLSRTKKNQIQNGNLNVPKKVNVYF